MTSTPNGEPADVLDVGEVRPFPVLLREIAADMRDLGIYDPSLPLAIEACAQRARDEHYAYLRGVASGEIVENHRGDRDGDR